METRNPSFLNDSVWLLPAVCWTDACMVMEAAAAGADSLIQLPSNGVPDAIAVSFAPSSGERKERREARGRQKGRGQESRVSK